MTPLALCIERLNCPQNLPQFTQCVVMPGNTPGLGLDRFAQISWQRSDDLACEFWLSLDDRLMLMRPSRGSETSYLKERLFPASA